MCIHKYLKRLVFCVLLMYCGSSFAINIKMKIVDDNEKGDVQWSLKINQNDMYYEPIPNTFGEYEINQSWHSFVDGDYHISGTLQAVETTQPLGACCFARARSINFPIQISFSPTITHASGIRVKLQTGNDLYLISDFKTKYENGFYVISLHVRTYLETTQLMKELNPTMSFFEGPRSF